MEWFYTVPRYLGKDEEKSIHWTVSPGLPLVASSQLGGLVRQPGSETRVEDGGLIDRAEPSARLIPAC